MPVIPRGDGRLLMTRPILPTILEKYLGTDSIWKMYRNSTKNQVNTPSLSRICQQRPLLYSFIENQWPVLPIVRIQDSSTTPLTIWMAAPITVSTNPNGNGRQ